MTDLQRQAIRFTTGVVEDLLKDRDNLQREIERLEEQQAFLEKDLSEARCRMIAAYEDAGLEY